MSLEEGLQGRPALAVGPGDQVGAGVVQEVEGDQVSRMFTDRFPDGTGAAAGALLQRGEVEPAGAVDDRLTVEDHVVAQGERGLDDLRKPEGQVLAVAGLEEDLAGPAKTSSR